MSVEPLILNEQINICRESSDFHGTFSVSFVFSLLYSLKCNMIISYLEPFQNLKYNFSTGNLIWLSTISTVLPQTYSSLSPGLKSLSGLWDSFFFFFSCLCEINQPNILWSQNCIRNKWGAG